MPDKKYEKTCTNGHKFYKSSDCPVCPICSAEDKPENGFLSTIGAPARRALERANITSLIMLAEYSEKEILQMHGVGPTTIPKLRSELESKGYKFKE